LKLVVAGTGVAISEPLWHAPWPGRMWWRPLLLALAYELALLSLPRTGLTRPATTFGAHVALLMNESNSA
jgi:hypothetical protein